MYINDEMMQRFLLEFDVARHKYLYKGLVDKTKEYEEEVLNYFLRSAKNGNWEIGTATETYLTLEKVYYLKESDKVEYCNLIQLTIEKMLVQYVDVEGIQELFKSSYFYFEWMMHLEYFEDRHSYSYYRDHYIHQIRNLYEMFVFLDNMDFWHLCMNNYMNKDNRVAIRIRRSIQEQLERNSKEKQDILENLCKKDREQLYYHYIIFATAIVSSLIHDIGYPIVFVKRTMGRMQKFLPISDLFMKIENAMPRIKSLLGSSLLFESVGAKEIEKRIQENDHGTYSAIILLYQYYDNGEIFSLEPVKRMVIELSALVIYNHTLRYEYQDKKKAHRYHTFFNDEPLSFLFRLCDDLQEWKRVYFEISDVSNFFICNHCKMPMIRGLKNKEKDMYSCFCEQEGINTNHFRYRRLLNVAPFKSIKIEKKGDKISIGLKSDLSDLLQVSKYNPMFAVHRSKGIYEIRSMLKEQNDIGRIYINTFISNNPVAIKSEILKKFLFERELLAKFFQDNCLDRLVINLEMKLNKLSVQEHIQKIKEKINKEKWADFIWSNFQENIEDSEWKHIEEEPSKEIFIKSIEFYLFIVLFGMTCIRGCNSIWKDKKLPSVLEDKFYSIAQLIAKEYNILDEATIVLVSDCLKQMYCRITEQEFFEDMYTEIYNASSFSRTDIPDVVKTYTQKEKYLKLCLCKKRNIEDKQNIYDYYSDYYFFVKMDSMLKYKKASKDLSDENKKTVLERC